MKSLFVMFLAISVLPALGQSQQAGVRYISDTDVPSRPVAKASLKSAEKAPAITAPRTAIDPAWDEELAQARQAHREICQENGYFHRHLSKKFKDEIESASEPLQKRFLSYHAERKLSRSEMHVLELDKQTELATVMFVNGSLTNADRQRMERIRDGYDRQIRQKSELVYLSLERAQMVSGEMAGLKSDCTQTARR